MSASYQPGTPTRTPTGWQYLDTPISDRSAACLTGVARRFADRPIPPYPCPDGCGELVTNWTQECYPQPWWDTPGLPPRRMADRCAHHGDDCTYRDDEPDRCPACHTIPERCTCNKIPNTQKEN